MAPAEVFLFSNDWFGKAFQQVAIERSRELGGRLTIVIADPVRGMTSLKRRRTRTTRPLRQLIERRQRGARVWLAEDVNAPDFHRRLPAGAHGLVTGYMEIFKRPTIDRFATFTNVHPSLLPYYRGPAPVHWCVQNGEQRSGYTLHEVAEEIDAGPVLRQGVVQIAGAKDPLRVIIDAALPAFVEWLGHLLGGAEFPLVSVDGAAVYRVLDGYRSLPTVR